MSDSTSAGITVFTSKDEAKRQLGELFNSLVSVVEKVDDSPTPADINLLTSTVANVFVEGAVILGSVVKSHS